MGKHKVLFSANYATFYEKITGDFTNEPIYIVGCTARAQKHFAQQNAVYMSL